MSDARDVEVILEKDNENSLCRRCVKASRTGSFTSSFESQEWGTQEY